MAYCRWRADCDVYAYEAAEGWLIHVKGGGAHVAATPGECADQLERLRESGLMVPQYAIDALRKEENGCPT